MEALITIYQRAGKCLQITPKIFANQIKSFNHGNILLKHSHKIACMVELDVLGLVSVSNLGLRQAQMLFVDTAADVFPRLI